MKNVKLLILSVILFLGLISITNILGLRFKLFNNQMLRWNSMNNPFIFIMAITLFNLCYNWKFTSLKVNKIASLSLLFYIIHDNLLLRLYIRPEIWNLIYEKYTYKYIILEDIIYSIIYFVLTGIVSYIYSMSIQKVIDKTINNSSPKRRKNLIKDKIQKMFDIN